ncbi:undecaprenyl-diphosphate phosphatase [bacterium]|nr:MAG: undecaprenyl-diphosphate phosphatase [bacterium]
MMSNFLSWVVCVQIIGESLPISSSSHVRLLMMLVSLVGGAAFFGQPIPDFLDHFLHGSMVLIIIFFFRHVWVPIFWRLVDVVRAYAFRVRVRDSQRALACVCLWLIFYVGCASVITALFYSVIKVILKYNAVLAHEATMLVGLCVTAGLLWSLRYVDLCPSIFQSSLKLRRTSSTNCSFDPSTSSGRTELRANGLQDKCDGCKKSCNVEKNIHALSVRPACPSKLVERSRELATPFKATKGEEWVEGSCVSKKNAAQSDLSKCEYASRCSKACSQNLRDKEQDNFETSKRTLCFNEKRRIELNQRQAQGERTDCVCDSCDYVSHCKKKVCPCLPVEESGVAEKNEDPSTSSGCTGLRVCGSLNKQEKRNGESFCSLAFNNKSVCPELVEGSACSACPSKCQRSRDLVYSTQSVDLSGEALAKSEGLRGEDQRAKTEEKKLTSFKIYAILGLVQGLALLPGISRFASTYVAARWLGFSTRRAFQVCFLLELPIVLAAFLVLGVGGACRQHGWAVVGEPSVMLTIVGATVVGYGALWAAWWLAERRLLWLFSVYLLLPILTVLYLIFQ